MKKSWDRPKNIEENDDDDGERNIEKINCMIVVVAAVIPFSYLIATNQLLSASDWNENLAKKFEV